MKKIFLLTALWIATTAVSAHTISKVSDDLRIEGNWCDGTYTLVADAGKKEGIWQWTLDGKVLTKETTHRVNMAQYGLGKYEVSLVNSNGKILLTDSYQLTTLPGPKADFGFDYLFAAGLVKFTNMTSSNTTDLTWVWDFGDGKTSNNQYPSHAYEKEGTYLVKLTATDANGCSNTVSMDVTWKYPGH